ncbi:MAG TPA: carboxypeptidase-like regulatory domain-containing protein, partial [Chitinophaga sp.]
MTVNFTRNSHRWGFMLLTIVLSFTSMRVVAQGPPINVTGVVKDAADGSRLVGVTITVSGTRGGAVTNAEGAFSIKAAEGSTITFSYIGYLPQTVKAESGHAQLNISLKADQKQLSDVVVIGYQETSRRNVTAAVTSVNPKAMADIPTPTLDALLQGRAPGLDVQNFSGEPGVRSNVVMRGNTAVSRTINSNMADPAGRASMARALSGPLYVIDGVPQSTEDLAAIAYGDGTNTDVLAGISINDIAQIDILKDASASAIYGSRGAGGVIIITTKKGVAGRTKVDFTTYHGFTERPQLDKVVIGAEERRAKMNLINHYGDWDHLSDLPQILTDSLNTAFNNANDYLGQMYQTGYVGDYNLAITGGGDKVTYRYGLDYYNEEGIVKKSGLKRYAFSTSLGLNLSKNLTINTQIRYYRLDRPRSINESTGSYSAFDGGYYANS